MVSSIVLGVIHAVCRNADSGYAEYHFIILLGVLMLGQHYYSDSHLTACHYAQRRYDEFCYTLRHYAEFLKAMLSFTMPSVMR